MAIYQLKTFLDIITTVLDETKVQAGDLNNYNRIKRDINIGYQDIVSRKNWRWLDRDTQVNHLAYIATGTIAVNQNSTTITFSSAPSISVAGYYISLDGDSEVYQIDTHTAAATSAVLKTVFIGTTSTASAYKLWADAVPLPTNVSETKVIRLDGSPEPLTPLGISDLKRLAAMNPKASGPPMFYATTDYVDPAPYAAVTSLPATATRASAGLTKTIKFAAGISSYLAVGDRLKITTAGNSSYNGEIEISAISTTTNASDTITYTGLTRLSESSTSDTGITVTMLGQKIQGEKYRQLVLFPSLSSDNRLLHVDYITSVQPLEEDTDEPLMPIEDRLILVYYGLYRTWSRMRNPEEATKNLALYEKKLNQMIGKLVDSKEKASLQPSRSYLKRKRSSPGSTNGGAGFFFESFGGTGSDTTIVAGANQVAIFDSVGNLNYSPTISTTELGYLNGVTSNIQDQLNGVMTDALQNGYIFIGDATDHAAAKAVTGDITITSAGVTSISAGVIVDADINASAAITRSKTAAGTAYRVLANDSSGVMSENAAITASRAVASDANGQLVASTTTATELGYVNGVTSAIQTQLNTKMSNTLTDGNIFVGNASNVATGVAVTGDIGLTNTGVTSISSGVIVNADVNASAAIARSKTASGTAYRVLANDSSGVMSENAAITASRAVASDANGQLVAATTTATELGYVNGVTSAIQTQLNAKVSTTLTSANILVGNGSNVATAVAVTGDIGITNAGVTSISSGVIVDADVNASAAITRSKTAAGTAYRILANNSSGVMSENAAITASRAVASDANGQLVAATTTATELGYVNGVTSAIQTQLDAKLTSTLADGKIFVGNVGNVASAVTPSGDVTMTNAGVTAIASGVIVNADINASAAIDYSKLAALTSANILVGSAGNVATVTPVTGDIGISNTGVTSISSGVIVNADVNASAAIDYSKLASMTSANILLGNGSNVPTVTAVTGDVTISNTGVTAIGANKVTLAQEAQIATASFKGRTTAGTGNVEVLTATQATALLNNVVGDSGSGGTKGLVPAPGAGDAAANKFLKADGTWTAPAGSGDFVGPGSSTDNAVVRFDGTTGKLGQNSVVTIDDSGATTGITTLSTSGLATLASATVTGATLLNGTVGLGDASADDISFNGSLATTIPIKTNATYNIGDSTHGLASVYLGSAGGLTTRIVGGATGSSYTLTLPVDDGTANQVLSTDGSGVLSWSTVATNALTDAHIFVGNASNVATDVAVTGDIGITNAGVTSISSGVIVNADINASAAIDYSKLAALTSANILVGSAGNVATVTPVTGDISITNTGVTAIASGVIVNADINASAAIDYSKLAALTSANILVGNASNVATVTPVTGDIGITNAGVTSISSGVIVNADVNASAAIDRTKIASGTNYRILANNSSGVMSENAAITASRAVASDANGQLVAATTTATELGYVNGVTSAIQTQLDAKLSTTLSNGTVLIGNGSNVATAVTLTGDVTTTNAGVTAIGSNKVTLGQMAQVATATFLGRTTAGTGNVEALTVTQATALLNNVVGDSGSGGTKGLVPAPASGDAAANKFLKADGTWTAPSGTGDVTGPASSTDNAIARFDSTTGKLLQNTSLATVDDDGAAVIGRKTFAVTSTPLTIVTATHKNGVLLVDTSASGANAAVNINLPTPAVGITFTVKDNGNYFGTNKCTLVRNGSEKIGLLSSSFDLESSGGSWEIYCNGTDWFIG